MPSTSDLSNFIKVTAAQYQTLITTGYITVGGTTYNYDPDAVYLVSGTAGTVTSVTIQATSPLACSSSAAITTTGTRTISVASGYTIPTTTAWNNHAALSDLPQILDLR